MNRKSLLICLIVFMIVIEFFIIFSAYITGYYAGLNKKSRIVLPTESDVIDDPGNDQIENDALIVKLKTIGNTKQQRHCAIFDCWNTKRAGKTAEHKPFSVR